MNLWFYILGINVVTFLLYGLDKKSARNGAARVPEYVLLLVGFAGGTVAAIVAQQFFRHKTRKLGFQFKFWALTMIQLAVLVLQPAEFTAIVNRFIH